MTDQQQPSNNHASPPVQEDFGLAMWQRELAQLAHDSKERLIEELQVQLDAPYLEARRFYEAYMAPQGTTNADGTLNGNCRFIGGTGEPFITHEPDKETANK